MPPKRRERVSSEAIVEAAEKCFGRWGIARTRMEDVAREAGVARPEIYQHFAGKDALLEAVIVRRIGIGQQQLKETAPVSGSVGDLLVHALIVAIEHPGRKALAEDEQSQRLLPLMAGSTTIREAMARFWRPYLQYAVDEGELRDGLELEEVSEWLTFFVFIFTIHPQLRPDPGLQQSYLRKFVVGSLLRSPLAVPAAPPGSR